LFPFRYIKEEFSNLSREQFIQALAAEGIPAWNGYKGLLWSMPYLDDAFQSKNYRLMYPKKMLDFDHFVAQNHCPESERLSNETGIWLSQNMLLGSHADMDDIYRAIEKIHAGSGKIKAKL
jgi:dTDP-4-amino-4,6-dideoxygalactose transaminase